MHDKILHLGLIVNKNVSWSRLILVWLGVILLTFAAYRLVRIQTYDLQQDVMIQQRSSFG
jgi:hypothetical protein